jgi:hypothetical protein
VIKRTVSPSFRRWVLAKLNGVGILPIGFHRPGHRINVGRERNPFVTDRFDGCRIDLFHLLRDHLFHRRVALSYDILHGVIGDLNFLERLQILCTIRMSNDILQSRVGSRNGCVVTNERRVRPDVATMLTLVLLELITAGPGT